MQHCIVKVSAYWIGENEKVYRGKHQESVKEN